MLFSVFPDNTPDDADDFGFGAVDGVVVVVFGHQPDLAVFPQEALDGGFVFDPGHHDLTVVRTLLRPDHDLVAVQDTGVNHTVTPDSQCEAAGFTPGHGALLIFHSQDGNAGGDHADYGDLAGPGTGDQCALAALGAGGLEQTLFLQRLQMIADRRVERRPTAAPISRTEGE